MGGNGFKLSLAEFRGVVSKSLEVIERNIEEIKVDIKEIKEKNSVKHNEFYTRIRRLENRPSVSVQPFKWVKAILGLIK